MFLIRSCDNGAQCTIFCGKYLLFNLFIWGLIVTHIFGMGLIDKNKPINFFCQDSKNPEVIAVVGAGLSGMLLSLKLAEKWCNIILLEAKDHVGGRIFTDFDNGVDLGAQWLVYFNSVELHQDFWVETNFWWTRKPYFNTCQRTQNSNSNSS